MDRRLVIRSSCQSLQGGQTCTLTARVTGATNRAVTWSFSPTVDGVTIGAGSAPGIILAQDYAPNDKGRPQYGEFYEVNEMYPGFVEQANAESNAVAAMKFGSALKVEDVHRQLFQAAEVALAAGGDVELKEYFVCGVCGYPAEGEAPEKCPICGAPREKFVRVS